MVTNKIRIGGMSCVNCQNTIERKLKGTGGVESAVVDFGGGTAIITYNEAVISRQEIGSIIEALGYQILEAPQKQGAVKLAQTGGLIVIIIALYMLMRQFSLSSFATAFPLAEAGMNYGMLLVIGLITSVHCVAMCGGINLSQTLGGGSSPGTGPRDFRVLLPSLLYNTGRVVSYTVIGAIVGALGSVLTVSGRFQGIIQLAAGVFMVIMGINMLGVFPGLRRLNLRLPKIFAKKINEQKTANRSPLLIGLLNGLMPCGPLQAIQLYALSTGSAAMGALSMFLFSVGTVPFMFILGAASSMLSKKFSLRVMSIGAVLVTVMGLIMLSNGWNLGGFPSPADTLAAIIKPAQVSASTNGRGATGSEITGGVQVVNSTLGSNRYPAITVQQGIPVKWTINAPQGSINGCNNRMIIREYGIEYRFKTGENVIEFTPEETGRFSYSCWMGMIRSSITVVAAGESAAVAEAEPLVKLIPAGVVIPTDAIAFSTFNEEQKYQEVTINLRDDGFTPSLVVVQRDIPTIWVINNDSLEPGNSELIFPAYYTTILMQNGDNPIQLLPDADFDFSTADNVYYGYVKVVDDINDVDTATIKSEVSDWETLIYPIEYFEAANQGMSCCN